MMGSSLPNDWSSIGIPVIVIPTWKEVPKETPKANMWLLQSLNRKLEIKGARPHCYWLWGTVKPNDLIMGENCSWFAPSLFERDDQLN